MPESGVVKLHLGDNYWLIAAGLKRGKGGELWADLMLENGRILYQDRAALDTDVGRRSWAEKAAQPDGPTAERMAEAILQYLLPDAIRVLQEGPPPKETQAERMAGLVGELVKRDPTDLGESAELFHDPSRTCYGTVPVGDHQETWPLQSRGFRLWLARYYYEQTGKAPNGASLNDAIVTLSAKAMFEGVERSVQVRLAEHEGRIYLDLCNDRWEAIEVDSAGWRIVTEPPVKFRRTTGMLPLPVPVAGGSMGDLRRFLNVPDDAKDGTVAPEWILAVSWLVAAFRSRGPYAILALISGHGRAKSSLQRVLRALIDPNTAPIRTLPRTEENLMLAATNGWVLAFDNVSHLADWQSDLLCRLSTGGGYGTRTLYTNLDETILDAMRPIVINGIEEFATRADLLDRALLLAQPKISKEQRRPEKRLWAEFLDARPAILGALLDVVAVAVGRVDAVQLDSYERMADFQEWIVAAESALPWPAGAFLAAYAENRRQAHDLAMSATAVAEKVRAFMAWRKTWEGTASALLVELEALADERITKQQTWPNSAQKLGNALRRLASNLEAVGVTITFDLRDEKGNRILRIENLTAEEPKPPPKPPTVNTQRAAKARANAGATDDGAPTEKTRRTGPRKYRD